MSRDRKKTMTRSRTSETKLDRIREAYLGMTFLRIFRVWAGERAVPLPGVRLT